MKTTILSLLALALLSLASCQKEAAVKPTVAPVNPVTPTTPVTVITTIPDTMPNKAIFKLQLVKDNMNNDETMFMFNKTANLAYDANEDGLYFAGFGQESLASVSKDGMDLAISALPYTPSMTIALDVQAKADGELSLKLSYEKNIPANIQILLTDNYLKSTINVRGSDYKFNVALADANTFGSKRFTITIKNKAQ